MQKAQLLQQIIAILRDSLCVLEKAARASHAEATHESSKAESKYDTRGLEAAYLAGGQARQAKEILDSIELYRACRFAILPPTTPSTSPPSWNLMLTVREPSISSGRGTVAWRLRVNARKSR
ncbi:MAG TPA: hypothetical protein VKY92_00020 [Verrucomicrobiae bacterium]|nr:hypothetical protein [Verrucomicrobiae bacterium]